MIRSTSVIVLATLITPTGKAYSRVPLADSLLEVSRQTYQAFQAKDWKQMQSLTTTDFAYVGSEGSLSGPQLAEATKDCVLKNFELKVLSAKMLSPTSAAVSYVAHQDESCSGKPAPAVLLNTDIFVRKQGKWLVSIHTEVAAHESPHG